jgi:hypothetical protein
MTYNNRSLAGQPILPYADFQSYLGQDVFANLSFLDHTKTPVTPLTLQYRMDDITNQQNLIPLTNVTTGLASSMVYQIPAASMQINYAWEGSIIAQISWSFTAVDSVTGTTFTGNSVNVVEIINIQVPG